MSRAPGEANRSRAAEWGCLAAFVLAAGAFGAQSWNLHLTEAANTDEGAMGEAGRLMLQGKLPHTDFPWFHMPGLPLFIGVGLKLTIGMYGLRLLYLAANCIAAVPLYWLMQRLRPNRAAALLAVFFYLTYHQMVHHDLRFLAVRQLANTLFIACLALASLRSASKRMFLAQSALSIASAMVFLPVAVNLAAGSIAAILLEPDRNARKRLLEFHVKAGMVTAAVIAMYFLLVPHSFDQAVLAQLGRAPVARLQRLSMMLASPDGFFYALSCASLLTGLLICPGVRSVIVCMLVMVAGSTLLGSNFFDHYPVLAAPAFCFGIHVFVLEVEAVCRRVSNVPARVPVLAACLAAAAVQGWFVYRPLVQVWFRNASPEYHALVRRIATTPGPLLTAQAVYGVEAGVPLLPELDEIYLRSPILTKEYNDQTLDAAARKAGAILLEPRGWRVLPTGIQQAWIGRFPVLMANKAGILLLVTPAQDAHARKR